MKYLVLCPGSLGFYTMLGYITKIKDQLDDLEEISGASAGAVLGFFLLSGKNLDEILNLTLNINLEEITKINLKTFIQSFGFVNHDLAKQKLIEIWGGNPTFKELSKKLHVSAYCVNTLKVEYFSRDTHPDMYVVDAICASVSVPFLFSTYEYDNKKYIDGATGEVNPSTPFLHKYFSNVLVVGTTYTYDDHYKVDNLFDYLKCIAFTGFRNRPDNSVFPNKMINVTGVMNFKATLEDRLKLFMIGYGA